MRLAHYEAVFYLGVIQTQDGQREMEDFGQPWHVFKLLTLRVATILPYIQEM